MATALSRAVAAAIALALSAATALADRDDSAWKRQGTPPPTILEDRPELFVPQRPRTAADEDRLEALALFSAARTLEERPDATGALRLYQRALRCDPESPAVARAIVALTAQLDRPAETIRYALKLAELEPVDARLLMGLAAHLTEQGKLPEAVALCQRAISREDPAGGTAMLVRLELGRLHYLQEKFDKAAEQLVQVLPLLEHPERYPLDEGVKKLFLADPAVSYAVIAEGCLRGGRVEEARRAFERLHRLRPNKASAAFDLARCDLAAKRPEAARQRLQTYFDLRGAGEGMAPYQALADALTALGRRGELIERLEKLRAADPDNVPLRYALAEKCRAAGQLDKARKLYVELAQKAPTPTGYRGLAAVYRTTKDHAALLEVLGDVTLKLGGLEALGEEERAVTSDAALRDALVQVATKRLKDDAPALSAGAALAAATLAAVAKQLDAADALFDHGLKQAKPDQRAEIALGWGLGLLGHDQYARAVKVFRRAATEKLSPRAEAGLWYYLAGALEMDGKTDEALQAAARAEKAAQQADAAPEKPAAKAKPAEADAESAELPPKMAVRCAARRAWVLYHAKRHDEAGKAYRALIDKFAADYSSEQTREALREARLVLSNLAVFRGDLPQAEEWLQQVLDEFPDDAGATNDLGYLWADQGKRLQRALAMCRKAVAAEPDNAAYRDSLGWAYFRLGRTAEALAELEKAAAHQPEAEVLDHLGEAYHAAKQPDKARQAWQRAAGTYAKNKEPEKAEKVRKKIPNP